MITKTVYRWSTTCLIIMLDDDHGLSPRSLHTHATPIESFSAKLRSCQKPPNSFRALVMSANILGFKS